MIIRMTTGGIASTNAFLIADESAKQAVIFDAPNDTVEPLIAEAKRAMDLLPESKDAFGGPDITLAAAEVYANVGDHDKACALLNHLLSVPSWLTVPLLQGDPAWDGLREDPCFQALLTKHGARS